MGRDRGHLRRPRTGRLHLWPDARNLASVVVLQPVLASAIPRNRRGFLQVGRVRASTSLRQGACGAEDGRPADGPDPRDSVRDAARPPPPGTRAGPYASPASMGEHRVKGASSSECRRYGRRAAIRTPPTVSRRRLRTLSKDDLVSALVDLRQDGPSTESVPTAETLADINSESEAARSHDLDALADLPLNEGSFHGRCAASSAETLADTEHAPSPTPSIEEDKVPETGHFVRLDSEVRVPACSHPSFRYTHMAREVRCALHTPHSTRCS
ncbi:hypothetical protein DFH07DRAFT_7335 [Mycena maculata]|uniref:Uncharacterized protein n=1 Tax=Mycena maculata TaxID=230809 RepID=A0AAD7KH44_9AGAR|nr:hypothetical protein DFH07DRAFT_7335 [Mycena maculata]